MPSPYWTTTHLGSNFFLTADSLDRSRGLCAAELLQELNTVRSNHINESPYDMILQNDPNYFKKFSVAKVATDVPEDQLLRLAALLWENNVPLLLIGHAYGLLGFLRAGGKPRSHSSGACHILTLSTMKIFDWIALFQQHFKSMWIQ